MKKYILDLRDRPYNAIKAGTKKVEGRVPTSWDTTPFKDLKGDDIIIFIRESDKEKLKTKVTFIHHYPDVETMLVSEGSKNVSSSSKSITEGIDSYHSIEEYKENIPLYGIYAIGVDSM